MFWSVFSRILWARRAIVAIVAASSLIGGAVVIVSSDPRYDATARVTLNIIKPDPITGQVVSSKQWAPYVQSQLGLVHDATVVIPAIEAVGWLDNPDIIAAYDSRPPTDHREFPAWVAQSVISSLQVNMFEDSNVLVIRFRASSPKLAELMAGAIRDAYISTTIQQKRDSAMADAEFQQGRARKIAIELATLEGRQTAIERQTGVILESNGSDVDSNRLTSLTAPNRSEMNVPLVEEGPTRAKNALVKLDSEILQTTAELGPNHPKLIELRRQRPALVAAAANETQVAGNTAVMTAARNAAEAAEIERQRSKVLSQRQTLMELRLLQDQIGPKRVSYQEAMARVIALRQLATTEDSGLSPIGAVETNPDPAFPNLPLILGGGGAVGAIAGVLIALLTELLDLRVRTSVGLSAAASAPVLGSIADCRSSKARRRVWKAWFRPRKLRPATA